MALLPGTKLSFPGSSSQVGVFSAKLGLLPGVQQANDYTLERDTDYVFQSYTCLGAQLYFINKAHPTRLPMLLFICRSPELLTFQVQYYNWLMLLIRM